MRNFSGPRSISVSQVHFTSLAVNGLPSCHLTPWRSGKISWVPSSLHDQPVARSGTIEATLFCATCWSNTTKLLNTGMTGVPAVIVDSSCIDMLAGLAKSGICRTPPDFCASAGATAARTAPSNAAGTANRSRLRPILPEAVEKRVM
jgi:hypothetical protein